MPPISLSDDAMTNVMRLVAPLLPHDRTAFMQALAALLRSEPVQPPNDGVVHRHCRHLLRTGLYKRQDWLMTAGGWHAPRKPVRGRPPAGKWIGEARTRREGGPGTRRGAW
jgi:hypothetical protein